MRARTLALACLFVLPASIPPASADPVVVELYTSQGCSSCPPADEMLGALAGEEGVLPLSMHVDYWDWIGWEDTFAEPAFGARQSLYAAAEGSRTRYTPQFIVSGTERIAGADGMELARVVDAQRATQTETLSAEAVPEGHAINLPDVTRAAQLVVVDYLPEATVKVMYGENAGRTMTYYNIVRAWDVLQDWDAGGDPTVVGPAPSGLSRAVILQAVTAEGYPAGVIGALRLD